MTNIKEFTISCNMTESCNFRRGTSDAKKQCYTSINKVTLLGLC